jgi:hypothetical protein
MKEELARRAVACKHWRWLPGMNTHADIGCGIAEMRILHNEHRDYLGDDELSFGSVSMSSTNALPDLTDAATLGCLLHLVREAWGEPGANASRDACGPWYVEWWCMETGTRRVIAFGHATEASALVAALEAAP